MVPAQRQQGASGLAGHRTRTSHDLGQASPPCLGKTAVRRDEPLQHWHDQTHRIDWGISRLGKQRAAVDKAAMELRRQRASAVAESSMADSAALRKIVPVIGSSPATS